MVRRAKYTSCYACGDDTSEESRSTFDPCYDTWCIPSVPTPCNQQPCISPCNQQPCVQYCYIPGPKGDKGDKGDQGPPGPPGNPATVSPSAFIGIYLPRAVLTSSTGSVFRPSTSTAIPNVRVVAPATGVTVGVVGGSSGLGSSASTVSITGGDIVLNGVDLDSTYEATVYVAGHFNVGSPNVTFALAALKTGSSQYVVLPNSMFTVCLEEHSFARQYTFYFNVSNQIVNQTGSSNTMTIRLVAFAGQNPYTGNPTDTVPPGNGTTPDIVFGYDHAVTIHVKQLQ